MVQDPQIPELAQAAAASLDSINLLLQATSNTINNSAAPGELAASQKNVLLDSVSVKRFHSAYKAWENSSKAHFVASQAAPYNHQVARMSRAYAEYEAHQARLADLRRAVRLPEISLSIETIRQYNNGQLLEHLEEPARSQPKVALSSLFSMSSDSQLPEPTLDVIGDLINIEYRLRMSLQIKNEVLLRLKSHLISKNSQWSARDSKLNSFLTRDLRKVYDDVVATRASEYEDLKYYEDDDMDEDDDKELESDEEREEDEENEGLEPEGIEPEGIEENEEAQIEVQENDLGIQHDRTQSEVEDAEGQVEDADQAENYEGAENSEGAEISEGHSISAFKDPDNNDDMVLE